MKPFLIFLIFCTTAFSGELHKKAALGDLNGVQVLLDSGVAVDTPDEHGRTALMYAVISGQEDIVLLLLTRGASPTYAVRMGEYKQNALTLSKKYRNQTIGFYVAMALEPNSKLELTGFLGEKYKRIKALYEWAQAETLKHTSLHDKVKKPIVDTLMRIIDELSSSAAHSLADRSLFYQAVQLLWQLGVPQKYCLSCFSKEKIAQSHYISACIMKEVSKFFFDPFSNQWASAEPNSIVASPLCCTGGSQSFCEQYFSKYEEQFSKEFIKKFVPQFNTQTSFKYDDSFYYVAVLHAFRIMLNNFRDDENWANIQKIEYATTFPAALAFIEDMRRFLTDRSRSHVSRAKVILFINPTQVHKVKGLSYQHFRYASPGHIGVVAHMGFNGFYFVIFDSEQTFQTLQDQFQGGIEIHPQGGTLETSTASGIPAGLQAQLDDFEAIIKRQLGRMDSQKMRAGNHKIPNNPPNQPSHYILLPEYVTLKPSGKIQFQSKDPIESFDDDLFYKPAAKNWFVIKTIPHHSGHKVTLGFEFDYPSTRSYLENCLSHPQEIDFEELAQLSQAKPWGRKSHLPVSYYPELPVEQIVPALLKHIKQTPKNNLVQASVANHWHWYTDNEVNQVLRERLREEHLGENEGIIQIAPLGGTHRGDQLRQNLNDEMRNHAGLAWDRTILVPYNIGNQHWVALLIQIQAGQVLVEYFDTLTETPVVPTWVEVELRAVYGHGVTITPAANYQQTDAHACGPLMIENLIQRVLGLRRQQPRFFNQHSAMIRTHHELLLRQANIQPTDHGLLANHAEDLLLRSIQVIPHALRIAWTWAALFKNNLNTYSKK